MKKIWIVANWKSNHDTSSALKWLAQVGPHIHHQNNVNVVVCPQFTQLEPILTEIEKHKYPILCGVQNISAFGVGAYTGEVAADTLSSDVFLALIGHSERRTYLSESDQIIDKKVQQSLKNHITPLVCVQNEDTVVPEGSELVAYEPVFAIGTGNADTPDNASVVAGKIKNRFGEKIEVLYGGSVDDSNCKQFISSDNISGLLIGRSSIDAQQFLKIVHICSDFLVG